MTIEDSTGDTNAPLRDIAAAAERIRAARAAPGAELNKLMREA